MKQKPMSSMLPVLNIEEWLKIRPEVLITKVGDRELHRWTKASFAQRTGNKSGKFRPNRYTNEVI